MAEIRSANRPKLFCLSIPEANTEYEYTMYPGVKRFTLKAREKVMLKIAFELGESNTNYLSLFPGDIWNEEEVYGDVTLFIQSPIANSTVEILQWI